MIDKFIRIIPEFKGKRRLTAALYRNKRSSTRDIIIKGRYGCIYKLPNLIENVGFDIFVNGIYESETIDFITTKCKNAKYFIDIGANIGSIAIPVSKRSPDLKIICIEASQNVFEYLNWNVEQNKLKNIKLIDKAVSDCDDQEVDFYSPDEKYGKGSMAPVFEKKGKTVKTITLRRIIEECTAGNIGMIKVDVEGFEYFVFKGGGSVLSSVDSPDILFEFVDWAERKAGINPGDAQQLLIEYGYKLFLLDRNKITNEVKTPLQIGAAMIWATKKSRF